MGFSVELLLIAMAFNGVLVCLVEGKVHYHDFVLTEKNFTRLCSTKSAMVVNGSLPGPTIYVNKGDTLYVNVHNEGNYKVTIHWHGVKQPRNSWFDGPEYITQCAIKSGTNFTYKVLFSDEEGTLWYHAHNEWIRNTVYGAIVIYPEEGNFYPFPNPDGEEILVLGSWYTYDVNLVVEQDLATGEDFPSSNSYTINGQPGDLCPCSKESTHRWQVEYGKTYLLRIVNAAMSSEMFFAISQHNLTIVGIDGSYLKPYNSNYIVIAPGNTMDVLLTANQPPGHYYMAARCYYSASLYFTEYDKTNVTAILEYKGNYTPPASSSFPFATLPNYTDINSANSFRENMKSLQDQDVPKNISTQMYIVAALNVFVTSNGSEAFFASSLNNVTWKNPQTDVLQAYYNNMSGFYTEDFPDMPPTFYDFVGEETLNVTISSKGTKVKVLEYGEEVEMVFQGSNLAAGAIEHPMHLHGYAFYVIGTGSGNFDFKQDPKTFNLVDPPLVNTASVPNYGWLAIRFKALNPGVWLWHCHLDHHLSWGMATVIIVKDGGSPETFLRKPPAYMPSCDDAPPIKLWKFQYSSETFQAKQHF